MTPEPSELGARRRWPIIVLVAVVSAVALTWMAWPRPVCGDDERAALIAVEPFGGVDAQVVDSGPEDQPSTAGCALSYSADAPAEEVAAYYADRLAALGWSEPLGGWIRPVEGDPFRLWVETDLADPAEHPDWDDLHYSVVLTEVDPERVTVDVAVRRYVRGVF
jgi:hypothetical protein